MHCFRSNEPNDKRAIRNKKSSDRFSSANRPLRIPNTSNEEGGKKKPPGILGNMPVKKVIRTSVSKDREENKDQPVEKDEDMVDEKSSDSNIDPLKVINA